MTNPSKTLEALLLEKRQFSPPKDFAKRAHVRSAVGLPQGGPQLRKVLGGVRRGARLVAALEEGARLEAAAREVVRRRQAQRLASTASTATCDGPRKNKAAIIWEGEPGDRRTLTYCDLLPRGLQVRQRAEDARRQEGRPRRDLHADDSRSWRSRCSPARASARSTRVVFGGFSAESLRDRINDCAGAGCSSPPTAATGAATIVPLKQNVDEALDGRPSIENVVVVQRGAGHAGPRSSEGRDHWWHRARCRTRRSTASRSRWTRRTCCTSSTPPARPASPRASCTRPAATCVGTYATTKLVFDLQGRRRLLVHGRHRLGHRPQLRRLRPARQRRDVRDVRGRARLARRRIASGTSSSATASRSSTRRRRRFARS